jgi:lambda repressor-like predicted transcriptional regulator
MRKFRYMPEIKNNNHLVRFLFEEMQRQKVCQLDLSERVGLHRDTLRNWRTRYTPKVDDLEAALNYLGYTLKTVRIKGE